MQHVLVTERLIAKLDDDDDDNDDDNDDDDDDDDDDDKLFLWYSRPTKGV